jgi:hypothetical protein
MVHVYVQVEIMLYLYTCTVYPPKTHVVLSAHVCPFPIRKL